MARLARVVVPRLPHHVIQRGVRSMAIVATDEERREYVRLLAEFAASYQVTFWAWCLMTNHVHLVVVPEQEAGHWVTASPVNGTVQNWGAIPSG